MRLLAVADSDSYLKWAAAVLDRAPSGWHTDLVLLDTDVHPTERQVRSALAGSSVNEVATLGLRGLTERVSATRPDVVLLATRGLMVRVLVRAIIDRVARRPLFVSGLPGISIPATGKAVYYRMQMDLVLLHSVREVREFGALAAEMGVEQEFALARLPFLPRPHGTDPVPRSGAGDLVFAAQAKVPAERSDRLQVVHWLIEAAHADSSRTVVLKLRGTGAEPQTHAERYPYDELIAGFGELPPNLEVSYRSMHDHLARAGGLATVSSTAAIEAIALGVPVLVLDDFGVDRSLINTVFVGSGLMGAATAMIAGDLRHPRPEWMHDNYFHADEDEDWVTVIERQVARRRIGPMRLRPAPRRLLDGAVRRAWDRRTAFGTRDRSVSGLVALTIGAPARRIYLAVRRIRRLLGPRDAIAIAPPSARHIESTPDVAVSVK